MCSQCDTEDPIVLTTFPILSLIEEFEIAPTAEYRVRRHGGEYSDFGLAETHLGKGDFEKLIDLSFHLRNWCWRCARDRIQSEMKWDFGLLKFGIILNHHKMYLNFIKDLDDQPEDWRTCLTKLVLDHGLSLAWFMVSELTASEYINQIRELGIQAHQFEAFASHVARTFSFTWNSPGSLLELLQKGYWSDVDVDLLSQSQRFAEDLYMDFNGLLPLVTTLLITGGYANYAQYRSFLWNIKVEDDEKEEARILQLVDVGVPIETLTDLGSMLFDYEFDDDFDDEVEHVSDSEVRDEYLQSIFDDLDDDLTDLNGNDFFECFVATLKMMQEIKLTINFSNFTKFWSMSSKSVLKAIDNEENNLNYFRSARLFEEDEQIATMASLLDYELPLEDAYLLTTKIQDSTVINAMSLRGISRELIVHLARQEEDFPLHQTVQWLDAGFAVTSLDEILHWWRHGFSPDSYRTWHDAGFSPSVAQSWRRHTEDPLVALRRIKAGIEP
jgi:hypothetical protein